MAAGAGLKILQNQISVVVVSVMTNTNVDFDGLLNLSTETTNNTSVVDSHNTSVVSDSHNTSNTTININVTFITNNHAGGGNLADETQSTTQEEEEQPNRHLTPREQPDNSQSGTDQHANENQEEEKEHGASFVPFPSPVSSPISPPGHYQTTKVK